MTLNAMRVWFGHYAKWMMGFMFVAMVVTTFSWNGLGRGNTGAAASQQQNPDDVVAKVDGQDITRGELDTQLDNMMRQFSNGGSISLMEEPFMRSYALEQIEQSYEQLAKAQQMGITATDSDVDNMRDKILKAQNVRKTLGLADNATLADIDTALQQQGTSLEDKLPAADIKQAIVLQKLQDKIQKSVVVSEQDTRDSYTQYHTQHILIGNQKRSDVQAQSLANQVLAKAKAPGADFSALAKQYSEDPGTKGKGGDDGWIDQSTRYVDEFKTAAFALKAGQVTPDLVKSPSYGYFIIKCEAIRSNLPKDFDAKKATYIAQYAQTKQNDAWQKFMSDLQAAPHNIVMIDPQLKGDKAFTDGQRLQPPDPTKQTQLYNEAVADYRTAIKNTPLNQDKALMYVQVANAEQQLKNPAAQADALEHALTANGTSDPEILMQLGDLYKQQGQNDKAVADYQKASSVAWNNFDMHRQLAGDFDALGHKDLGDLERQWMKAHPQAPPPNMAGGPGGSPISITPVGGGGAHPITVHTTSGKPAAQPVKPAQ